MFARIGQNLSNLHVSVSPFAPITPVDAWWKADALSLTDGTSISNWPDSSGNGFNFTQSDATLQPIFKTNIQNGLSVVQITTSSLQGTGMTIAGSSIAVGNNYTIFAVYNKLTTGNGGQRILQGVSANWLIGPYSDNAAFYNGAFSSPAYGMTPFVFICQTVWDDNTTGHNRVNGTEIGTTAGNTAPGNLALDGAGAFPTNTSPANIGEILVYKRTLNLNDILTTEQYLRNKWGI